MPYHLFVTDQSIQIDEALAMVQHPNHGAIDMFIGTVRNHHQGRDVIGISYDVHHQLTLKAFKNICHESEIKWPNTHYYIAHYKGDLPIGGISILIAVSSTHRHESFEACRFVIEEVKSRAPIWKREHYADGLSEWLPGHNLKSERSHA